MTEFHRPPGGPHAAHAFGWGQHPSMYGFDERFLAHVVYWHLTHRGKLLTVVVPPLVDAGPIRADLEAQQAHGNQLLAVQH